jgi:tRNA-dihydrouridine synthase 3
VSCSADALAARDEAADARALRPDARLRPAERPRLEVAGKVYIAPLTTVGNLPFRRIMKDYGADITCGEMALAGNLVAGSVAEWALLRRHACEDVFGVQLAGAHVDVMGRAAELIQEECSVSFIDINCGCPLDAVCNKGMGAGMMGKAGRLRDVLVAMRRATDVPITVKMRTGLEKDTAARFAHKLVNKVRLWSVSESAAGRGAFPTSAALSKEWWTDVVPLAASVTVHGRTRQQRYSAYADRDYMRACVSAASGPMYITRGQLRTDGVPAGGLGSAAPTGPYAHHLTAAPAASAADHDLVQVDAPSVPLIGNGDVLSWEDWHSMREQCGVATALIGRGALIKPWLSTEIKERRTWDISSRERLDILRAFVHYGLEHWGSDQQGVNHTRRFLLEWLSFLCRYIPAGLLETLPQRMNDRPRPFVGRDDLETLMASTHAEDWVRITEMLLGPVPTDFVFLPKHKSNSYEGGNGESGGSGRIAITASALQGRGGGGVVLGKRAHGSMAVSSEGAAEAADWGELADADGSGSDVQG